jgi:hypothetical protein
MLRSSSATGSSQMTLLLVARDRLTDTEVKQHWQLRDELVVQDVVNVPRFVVLRLGLP